jgi:crotonobetainyl-CoA:carnitine CoA-transferase CaiB-like acyl-CoA transferase
LVLDLRAGEGLALRRELIPTADIFACNLRTKKLDLTATGSNPGANPP